MFNSFEVKSALKYNLFQGFNRLALLHLIKSTLIACRAMQLRFVFKILETLLNNAFKFKMFTISTSSVRLLSSPEPPTVNEEFSQGR